ncbi:unnamed protein product [Bursaphelenchus okinawaensis]|uniref:Anoctamin n=1 Tax=Bursaphelenchus okinawaensis TaxID=465554 RepID=A0A811KSF6_9BILA|nr:unnamed protein product [Bursaphelenchus okinawaensis]CAG9110967.1 unnamed protein product [Bursaphelenchus okinawaensis]
MREFAFDEAQCFLNIECKESFFSQMERTMIVKQMLDMIRSPNGGLTYQIGLKDEQCNFVPDGRPLITFLRSGRHGLVDHVLPLHDAEELKDLQRKWVLTFDLQPLDSIKDYFGTEIAMYFAWLGHLTAALGAPAIFGLILWMLQWGVGNESKHYCGQIDEEGVCDGEDGNTLFSDICFVIFAFFNCVWSTAYIEHWKRRQAELAFQWGTYDVERDPLMDDPRPAFKGDLAPNPVSGRIEPHYPHWKHAIIRFGVTYPITLLCCLFMFLMMFVLLYLQDVTEQYFQDSFFLSWLIYVPIVIYALMVMVADQLYRHLALFFNDLENYRTDDEYETFLITKIALFQCVSAFGSLFYIAFFMNDMKRLRDTLATLLFARQFTQNFFEVAAPFVMERLKFWRLSYRMTRTLSERSLRRHVEIAKEEKIRRQTSVDKDGKSPDFENLVENEVSFRFSNDENEGITNGKATQNDANGTKIEENGHSLGVKRPSTLVDNQFSPNRLRRSNFSTKNVELLTKLATPQASSNARLPLPEFCPTDKFVFTDAELQSLMTVYARPLDDYLEMFIQFGYVLLFSPAFPLAAVFCLFSNMLEIRVDAFKLCNAVQRPFGRQVKNIGAWQKAMEIMGVLGVVVNCALIGQSGLVQRLLPGLSFGGQVLLVVILEHVVLAAKFLLDMAIPDVPLWIRVQTAKMEHWRREAYKRESKLNSRRGSAHQSPVPVFQPASVQSSSPPNQRHTDRVEVSSSRPQIPVETNRGFGRFVRKRAPLPGLFKNWALNRTHRSVTPTTNRLRFEDRKDI